MQKSKKPKETIEVIDDEWALGLSGESEAEDSVERDPDWVETLRQPRRSGRRTNSIETTSLSEVNNSAREQVRQKMNHWELKQRRL